MFLLFFLGNQLVSKHAPWVDASMEIKLEATTAHLWFEEIMAGDRHESITTVWSHLDSADWYANAMLNGGENDEGIYLALEDSHMRASIISVLKSLDDFKDIALERYTNFKGSTPGSDIDQQFDAVFIKFISEADTVEALVLQLIKKDLKQFRYTAFALLFISFISALLLSNYLYRREKHSTKLLDSLTEATASIEIKNKELERIAHYDELTGLPNRVLFSDRLEQAIVHSQRKQSAFALLFIDLDHFKSVNDRYGHKFGDVLLQQASSRIQHYIRADDTAVRLSGDEFVVILYDIPNQKAATNAASTVANKIIKAMQEPFDMNGPTAYVTASIGIAVYPDDSSKGDGLIRYADSAMYHSKSQGKNRYQFYSRELNQLAMHQLEIEHDLRDAVKRDQLEVYYHPQWDLSTNKITGIEALVRWNHPQRGLIMPDEFIPVAESCGMIQQIDNVVMKKALAQYNMWKNKGYEFGRMALNVSPVYFCRPDFLAHIVECITKNEIQGDDLEIEITESVLFENSSRTQNILTSLNKLGVRIAIDDFGTGYSSMTYLRNFSVHTLKIDRSFVADYDQSKISTAILKNMVTLGLDLGLDIVAEGIETKNQQYHLQKLGCGNGQGYLFTQPLPAQEIEYLLLPKQSNNIRTINFQQ